MSLIPEKRDALKTELSNEDIDFIMANTELDKESILKWHADFKKNCPDNKLDKPKFVKFYKNLIPGDSQDEASLCEYVFQAFDVDLNGTIDFAEFLLSFWVRSKGSLKEKLTWLFSIYDTDRSNCITSWELNKVLKLVFAIKNIKEDPYQKSKKIFELMDRSKDNRITKEEFIAGCTKDETLRELFAPF